MQAKQGITTTFQSTPSRGGRRTNCIPVPKRRSFQSTPSRGGRPNSGSAELGLKDFNPRPHEEGDVEFAVVDGKLVLNFNPRPHEEGDILALFHRITQADFNPRPHEEGDTKKMHKCVKWSYFNPRPHEEGDENEQRENPKGIRFQSTPSRGGRRYL